MGDGVLVFQGPALSSGGGLRSLHAVAHRGALVDRRGRAVARQPLSRALILASALMVVAVLLTSLRRGLLLALGNEARPRSMQRQERALDQFILQRVDELLRLQRRERRQERKKKRELSGLRESAPARGLEENTV